jgi:hypothetical protein
LSVRIRRARRRLLAAPSRARRGITDRAAAGTANDRVPSTRSRAVLAGPAPRVRPRVRPQRAAATSAPLSEARIRGMRPAHSLVTCTRGRTRVHGDTTPSGRRVLGLPDSSDTVPGSWRPSASVGATASAQRVHLVACHRNESTGHPVRVEFSVVDSRGMAGVALRGTALARSRGAAGTQRERKWSWRLKSPTTRSF